MILENTARKTPKQNIHLPADWETWKMSERSQERKTIWLMGRSGAIGIRQLVNVRVDMM
jgi:hypothetical protein